MFFAKRTSLSSKSLFKSFVFDDEKDVVTSSHESRALRKQTTFFENVFDAKIRSFR